MVLINLLIVAGLSLYLAPRELSVDLSRGRHVSAIEWPETAPRDLHAKQGKIDLTLTVAEGKVYRGRARTVSFDRRGDVIGSVKAAGEPMTMDDVVARLKDLSQEWGFSLSNLPEWRRNAEKGSLAPYVSHTRPAPSEPEVAVEIRPSFNQSRPWVIMFQVYWPLELDAQE